MGITGCCNKSENENITSSPRVFCSYIIFAGVIKRDRGGVGPSRGAVVPLRPTRGPPPWCRLSARRQRTVIGAIRCGETFESRMPLGRVSITSEQMAAPGGWAMGHLFFIAARLSHDEKRNSLRRNAETGGLRAREIGCWGRSARAARGILERIPLRFEHSLYGERSSCTLLPRNRQRSVRSGAIDAEWCARRPCAGQPSLC